MLNSYKIGEKKLTVPVIEEIIKSKSILIIRDSVKRRVSASRNFLDDKVSESNDAMYGVKLQEGKPEKHPDPAGIGSGKESTPVPGYINDCCLMDYGNWEDTCNNGDDDVCENPRNDPIKKASDILKDRIIFLSFKKSNL